MLIIETASHFRDAILFGLVSGVACCFVSYDIVVRPQHQNGFQDGVKHRTAKPSAVQRRYGMCCDCLHKS